MCVSESLSALKTSKKKKDRQGCVRRKRSTAIAREILFKRTKRTITARSVRVTHTEDTPLALNVFARQSHLPAMGFYTKNVKCGLLLQSSSSSFHMCVCDAHFGFLVESILCMVCLTTTHMIHMCVPIQLLIIRVMVRNELADD